jgi:hypothetical protein
MSAELITDYDEMNEWERYESLKATLPDDLTFEEYERACRELATELGI